MSSKNKQRKAESESRKGLSLPWTAHGDVVVDRDGNIVKAPHGCSWEGRNYRDNDTAARAIADAVNRQYGDGEQ